MDTLEFIVGLMKQDYPALSFIPYTTVQNRYIQNGQYILSDRNGNPNGYLLHGVAKPGQYLSVAQAMIDYDFRNRDYGRAMIEELIKRAEMKSCKGITLRCAEGLESNLFWQAMGFELTATETN